ncbi:MAG: hypothetical protein RLY20_872 [Verrucomicrobiota bacterium]|jgi:hypothetical protein
MTLRLGDTVRVEVPHRIDASEWEAHWAYFCAHGHPKPFPYEIVTLTNQADVDAINSIGLDAWAQNRQPVTEGDE